MKPAEEDDEDLEAVASEEPPVETDSRVDLLEDTSTWRAWLYGGVALAMVFLGGGREIGSLALVATMMGLALIIAPPRYRLPAIPTVCVLLLAVLPGVGLLPAAWLGGLEEWRTTLMEAWSLTLPSTHSPMPAASFQGWMVMFCCVAWLWACLGQNFSDSSRRTLIRLLAGGGIVIAFISLLEVWTSLRVPWWPRPSLVDSTEFGPFANRNHSSSFLAVVGVLAQVAAYDAFRRRSWLGAFFSVGILVPLVGILTTTSRGGLLLFLLGTMAWIGTSAMKSGLARKAAVAFAVFIMILSITIVSGGKLGVKITEAPVSEVLSPGLRLQLAKETLAAASWAPWTGRGLDTYRTLLSLVSSEPFPEMRPFHPESDVLWLLFEGGLLLLLPSLVLGLWIFSHSGPWARRQRKKQRDRSARRLRRAFTLVAAMALIHGLFDVPNHSVGYFMITSLLLAAAINPRHIVGKLGSLSIHGLRLVGVGVLLLGLGWAAVALGRWSPSIPVVAFRLHDEAVLEAAEGRPAEAMVKVERALSILPLEYRFYFLRAQLHNQLRRPIDRALQDFGRVRALEPRLASVCMEEGIYWLKVSPPLALIPWRECLRRYPAEAHMAVSYYHHMVWNSLPHPEIRQPLWRLARDIPMQVTFLSQPASREEWARCMEEFLSQHPRFEGVDEKHVQQLLYMWELHGDRAGLVKMLNSHSRLKLLGWRVLATEYARAGEFEAAYEIAAKNIPVPARTAGIGVADIPRLERAFLFNPSDPRPGIELYYAQRMAGDLKAAQLTLEKLVQLPEPPSFLKREMASLQAQLGDHRRAWELIQQALQEVE